MSAQEQMRQRLDELMGTGRDGPTKNSIHYSDPKVCRCFLLGLCPHEALSGTKMALGECLKIHDYALKADFENSSKTCRSSQHRFYELTVLTYLQKVIRSCEIMDRAKKGRLSRCQAQTGGAVAAEKQAELKRYGNMVDKKIAEAEELGFSGMVEESLALIREIERIKRKRTRIEKYLLRKSSEPVKEQKQTICEECQLCIGLDDNEQRVANHSSGRLHHAMLAIRQKITELSTKLEGIKLPGEGWARLEAQQQMRMSLNPGLASTRARSYSSHSRSSSRSRSRSRYSSYSRSSRSYSRYRSSSRSYYSRSRSSGSKSRNSWSRSRTRSRTRSRSTRRTRSRSWTRSRIRSRSRSSCRWRSRSRSSSKARLRMRSRSTSLSNNKYGKGRKRSYTKSSSVTRTRCKSPQDKSGQQCLSLKDYAKSSPQLALTCEELKGESERRQKPTGTSEECYDQMQNRGCLITSGNANRPFRKLTDRKLCSEKPLSESKLRGPPDENLKICPDLNFTKKNINPKSGVRSRSESSRSDSMSPGRKPSTHVSLHRKKTRMRTRTKMDFKDRKPEDLTAKELDGQVKHGQTPDSETPTRDMKSAGNGDVKTEVKFSSSSPSPTFKRKKVIKRNYRSKCRRSESSEESNRSTSSSESRCNRKGAKESDTKKRKSKHRKRRLSTSSSESRTRRKLSGSKRAKKTVTKKRKTLLKSKTTRPKTATKKPKKRRSVSPSPLFSADSSEEQRCKKRRRIRTKRKTAPEAKKSNANERGKSSKGTKHKDGRI